MPKFMFVFRGGPRMPPRMPPEELQRHLREWGDWLGALARDGFHVGGNPLQNGCRTIHGGARKCSDGSQGGLKDVVSGSMLIEAPSFDVATQLATNCPVLEIDGSVEVWPLPAEASEAALPQFRLAAE